MFYKSNDQIEELICYFENRTLPKSAWTHAAHLTAGMYYLHLHDFYSALCIMKSNIITYNISVGGENSFKAGYHETLTVFWLRIIDRFLNDQRHEPLFELCNEFLMSPSASKELPLEYYTKERLFSTQARATWIEPDLR